MVYPVFKIPTYVQKVFLRGDLVVSFDGKEEKVLDDRSIQKETLGERRLLMLGVHNLVTLSEALYELKDVILTSKKQTRYATYIDSSGIVFDYRKTDWAIIKSYRIEKCTTAPTTKIQQILKLRGVHCPIVSKHPPSVTNGYASLLNYSNGYIFMGYSDLQHEPYRFKI